MTRPLALVFYESLLTGNQLMNRLDELGYRVVAVHDLALLPAQAAREKPLVVLLELGAMADRVCAATRSLGASEATAHVPVIAYVAAGDAVLAERNAEGARRAGARLVAMSANVVVQLDDLLDQALHVD